MSTEQQKPKQCGALWRKVSKNDPQVRYFSGVFESEDGTKTFFKAFVNSYKEEGSNQPDYRLILDTPIQEQVEQVATVKKTVAAKPAATKTVVKKVVKPAPVQEEEQQQEEVVMLD